MPKTPTDYSKAVIYKIEHLEKPELVYVGSTTDFIKRKSQHKTVCNNENSKKFNCKLYQLIRDNGNWESFKMMIIQEFPCNTKTELIIEEEKHRKELQASLNSYKSCRTIDEIKSNIIDYNKVNKDKIKEQRKEYYKNNKEKLLEYNKNYHQEVKTYKQEKMTCECGSIFRMCDKSRHEKTIKHCQFLLH